MAPTWVTTSGGPFVFAANPDDSIPIVAMLGDDDASDDADRLEDCGNATAEQIRQGAERLKTAVRELEEIFSGNEHTISGLQWFSELADDVITLVDERIAA